MARIRVEPEDFEVEEIPRFQARGEGAYALVWLEKRLANTEDVAQSLAAALNLKADDVAYAGRKDKRALTRQYFSLPWQQDPQRLLALPIPGARILRVERHDQKLGPGKLDGNRFRLKVREVEPNQAAAAEELSRRIAARGLANRFGKQRYGRDGDNAAKGREILLGGPRGDRRAAAFLISALQSQLFDLVLGRRPIDRLLPGDVGFVHATGETLWLRGNEEEQQRAEAFELSPTGPIFGSKMKQPRQEAARIEREAAAELGLPKLDTIQPPPGLRLFGDRRSLRVRPRDLSLAYDAEEKILDLAFILPPGSYATVLLEEILPGGFVEGQPGDD